MNINRDATTQQVATALRLRPATVQLYARNGRIPFDTTPGGHRRYNIDEVREALGVGAQQSVAPPTRFRGRRGWLVDATELDSWADRRASQDELPQILRWLVSGSVPELGHLHFRAGEGIGTAGWDGLVNTVHGNAWVPGDQSAWETGTDEDVTRKANDDYESRTQNPLGLNQAETTFVFVTPRRWPRRDSWATARRAEGVWKDVRAFDADSLEEWLDATPAVHARVTKLMGRDPDGAADLASAWGRFAGRTSPQLPPDLLTAGRDEEAAQAVAWLRGAPSVLSVVAESGDEAFGFIAACLKQLPEGDLAVIEARTMVIRTAEAWDEVLARTTNPLLLIPVFENPSTAEATDAGHHVALPLDLNAVPTGKSTTLPRLRREPAVAALVRHGLEKNQAEELAALARRSLLVLQRHLAVDATVARPAWAQPDRVNDVIPAMLAGVWRDDFVPDRDVLASLAKRPYDDLIEVLARWQTLPDSPVRKLGNLWFITSKEDAWDLTLRFLSPGHLERFRGEVLKVLAAVDPALDVDPGRRWSAAMLGKVRPWSQRLRVGMAETIALMATRSGTAALGGMTGQEFADQLLLDVFGRANADASGRLWSSLADVLPLLAEASPGRFLDAIDSGISNGSISKIFDPAVEEQPFGSPMHTGLLWALEAVAWNPDHLGGSAVALAKLAEHDPGGRWANRPASSLREIFLPWLPHTRASLDDRVAVLDRLRRATPAIAWKLMVSLLPSFHQTSMSTYKPRWRDGEPENRPNITLGELERHVDAMTQRLVDDAHKDGSRWADLVVPSAVLPPGAYDTVVSELEGMDPRSMVTEDREAIVNSLRDVVFQHRRFPDAVWAMPTVRIDRLDALLYRFEETDLVHRSVWLFSHRASLSQPRSGDLKAEQEAIKRTRVGAVQGVLRTAGLEGIWQLGSMCELPMLLGVTLAHSDAPVEEAMIEQLGASDTARHQVAEGYVIGRFEVDRWSWAERYLSRVSDWPHAQAVRFLHCLPAEQNTFGWVERLGDDVSKGYWENLNPLLVQGQDRNWAIEKLLKYGRPSATLGLIDELITKQEGEQGEAVDPDLLLQVLSETARGGLHGDATMVAYYVANLLNHLGSLPGVDRARLAQLEWQYLPLLEHMSRPPLILFEELRRNPEFFVEVVCWVYKAETDQGDAEITDDAMARAHLGYQLLNSWNTAPGVGTDGEGPTLEDWVVHTRELLIERGRIRIGDNCIGRVLRYVPVDADGAWPTLAVRELIESICSQDLEHGVELEVYNSRGATFRSLSDGGKQERVLAKQYQEYARRVGGKWPRTRRMLERISENWDRDARREDQLTEEREDFWS